MEIKITSVVELRESIVLLEIKQAYEAQLLKDECKIIFESMKPMNVIKKTFNDFKEDLLYNTVGLTAGYVSKAIVVGQSVNPLKRLLGSVVQLGISTLVSKNPETITALTSNVFKYFTRSKKVVVKPKTEHNY